MRADRKEVPTHVERDHLRVHTAGMASSRRSFHPRIEVFPAPSGLLVCIADLSAPAAVRANFDVDDGVLAIQILGDEGVWSGAVSIPMAVDPDSATATFAD